MFVLYLDAYHLGDPLFTTGLARDLRARMDAGGDGLILVLGAGEEGERALEALGAEPRREAGGLVTASAEQAAAVERAARDAHRRLVETLSEAGVSAVRIAATDRGLARLDGTLGRTGWLAALARQRAVPVVLAIVVDEDGTVRELDPAGLAGRLAEAVGEGPPVALGTPPQGAETASLDEAVALVPDGEALRRMAFEASGALVARRSALRQPGVPAGVRVHVARG